MKIYTWDNMEDIVRAVKERQIIAFPTDTVYGVGVLYGDLKALDRLKKAKHRPEEKPVPMMISNVEQIDAVAHVSEKTKRLIDALMPGGLTIVVPLKENVPRQYTNGKDTIALRMPDSKPLLELIERAGAPMMVTSANMSGEPTALTFEDACAQLPHIDGIVKGECQDLQASTIVDCTNDEFVVLRQGAIPAETIREVL